MNYQQYSDNTQQYLICFYEILNQMIADMTNASLSCSLSSDFINQMIPHHRAAIHMSRNLLMYTTNIPLQNIAQNIIKEQTQSIRNMQDIQNCCLSLHNSQDQINSYFNKYNSITWTMFENMQNAPTNNDINISFMNEMIPHHEGAVRLSKNALEHCICPQLIPILEAIITSQEKGISEMKKQLSELKSC